MKHKVSEGECLTNQSRARGPAGDRGTPTCTATGQPSGVDPKPLPEEEGKGEEERRGWE